jgi:ADP-dependent NAD(P)H-hydrate dehydratase / NAD(P)H-hydrate epimerase
VLLKGAYTAIATPTGELHFNSTGNPGMATGGNGDVLTGVVVALLAQGLSPLDAARLGAWVHGRAGDLAARQHGERGLTAADVADNVGRAFLAPTV